MLTLPTSLALRLALKACEAGLTLAANERQTPTRHFMKLFISYASEDQADFVQPLADSLSKHYEVFYAPYSLKVGDRLLQKIDEGLASCDFGVVVLSKAFFEKKWPQAELDGLFARETPARKLILPVWKDVGVEEVTKFSPILAGRLAAHSSKGVEEVVTQIRLAIDSSERTRTFDPLKSVKEGFMALVRRISEKRAAEQLLDSREGADLLWKAFDALFRTFQSELLPLNQTSKEIKFKVTRNHQNEIYVATWMGLSLDLRIRNLALSEYCHPSSDAFQGGAKAAI